MKTAYSLHFPVGIEERNYPTGKLPPWCKNLMLFASSTTHYTAEGSELIIQRAEVCPFNIDLIEIQTSKDWKIPFVLNEKQMFLFFLFEGNLLFTSNNYQLVGRVPGNRFLMSYFDKGIYYANASRGYLLALVVNINPEWLEKLSVGYSKLETLLNDYRSMTANARIHQQFNIDEKISRWLNEIYVNSNKNAVMTESSILLCLSYILEYYDFLLSQQTHDPVYKVLHYLNEHYKNNNLSITFLADKFHITERTLLKRFKEEFSTTLYQYCTLLRMRCAEKMIEINKLSIEEVYMEVGYKNKNAFRIAYNKFKRSK